MKAKQLVQTGTNRATKLAKNISICNIFDKKFYAAGLEQIDSGVLWHKKVPPDFQAGLITYNL
jgi:hypothetical protein